MNRGIQNNEVKKAQAVRIMLDHFKSTMPCWQERMDEVMEFGKPCISH